MEDTNDAAESACCEVVAAEELDLLLGFGKGSHGVWRAWYGGRGVQGVVCRAWCAGRGVEDVVWRMWCGGFVRCSRDISMKCWLRGDSRVSG
jgi:hypothetical protein